MKVAIINLGCKVNQCECDSLAVRFAELGYEVAQDFVAADIYVINTCAVTQEAEKKSRQCVARVRKYNPHAKVYVIGCASQKNADQFANKDVTYVGGTADKASVCNGVEGVHIGDLPTIFEDLPMAKGEHARQIVKIQDGCNNFCSYCIVPYLRGRSRSRNLAEIVSECKQKASYTREIVITGINVSAYGKDIGLSLVDLVKELSAIQNVRFRFGSLEVNVIDEDLLSAMQKAGNFCPHFHLSLQSGDDGVLKDMNRHYTTKQYADKVSLIRSYYPYACITTDIIVGFATESDQAFANSLQFAQQMAFADIHVFPYSRRQGTKAYNMGEICAESMKNRVAQMTELKNRMHQNYLRTFVGQTLSVVMEQSDGLFAIGHTDNYIKVYVEEKEPFDHTKLYTVLAVQSFRDGLLGEYIDKE